jgi:regulator of protease activity HflC (stomatin/prohibitin superfamily)
MAAPTVNRGDGRARLSWWAALLGFVALVAVGAAILGLASPEVIVSLLLLVLSIVTVASSVEVVQAYEQRPVTIFGRFRRVLGPGLTFIPPFVSRTYIFDMRTQTLDIPTQRAITEDNSPVTADAVVYIRVMNAKEAFLEVEDYKSAVSNLAQTTLRAVIGDMELDETLREREEINRRIHVELDEPTDEWGVRVEGVEVREVLPTPTVQDAMEEQTSAERRRRAAIIEAQGQRRAAVERAKGNRDAAILRAQGEKQSQILEAQGDAVATVLRARAAESLGERAVIDMGLETLTAIGKGPATSVVLPQELTSLVGRSGRHLEETPDRPVRVPLLGQSLEEDDRELIGIDDIESVLTDEELPPAAVRDAGGES